MPYYDALINYVLLFLFLEFYEVSWQRAPSLMGMLLRMQKYYKKSILLFLLMHPTYYFAILFAMLCDYHWSAMLLLFLKTFDIATKIRLLEQVFKKQEISQELGVVLLTPLHPFLPYIGMLVYPFFIALVFL